MKSMPDDARDAYNLAYSAKGISNPKVNASAINTDQHDSVLRFKTPKADQEKQRLQAEMMASPGGRYLSQLKGKEQAKEINRISDINRSFGGRTIAQVLVDIGLAKK
jgi:outer membrane translocation and assembly module TamA